MFILLRKFLFHLVLVTHQSSCHKGILRSIFHPDHRTRINRCNLQCHMQLAGSRTSDHNRNIKTCPLQFLRHIHHFLKTWCDQATESDDIHMCFNGFLHNLLCWHHHTHINNLIVIAGHHHPDNVLTDIMDITFDCSQQHLSGTGSTLGFLGFNIRLKDTDSLFHCTGSLHDLWQEHLSFTETLSDCIHTSHQGSFNNIHSMRILL